MTKVDIISFGCSLDPDERAEYIQRKIEYVMSRRFLRRKYQDPYDAISHLMKLIEGKTAIFSKKGKIDVETWLTPSPLLSDLPLLNVPNFVTFIDSNGCQEYAERVFRFTKEEVLPKIPFLIGVDHSMTGGVLKALSEMYGKDDILVIFVDSHFDGISLPTRLGLIHYDIETNPQTIYKKDDPYIYDRPNSYNTESFIRFLVENSVVLPENTICIGVSNHPPIRAFEIDDRRVKKYVEEFNSLEKKGLTIVKKDHIQRNPSVLEDVFSERDVKCIYISIDADIGANATTGGVRYSTGYIGMRIDEIRKMLNDIKRFALKKGSLIGFDLMEIDIRTANESTYAMALTIINEILR